MFFKVVMLCALIHITYGTTNFSATLPVQVLKELTEIGSGKSKGLFPLWKDASFLKNDKLLKDEVRVTSAHACIARTFILSLLHVLLNNNCY